jgi:hypothetical protein
MFTKKLIIYVASKIHHNISYILIVHLIDKKSVVVIKWKYSTKFDARKNSRLIMVSKIFSLKMVQLPIKRKYGSRLPRL